MSSFLLFNWNYDFDDDFANSFEKSERFRKITRTAVRFAVRGNRPDGPAHCKLYPNILLLLLHYTKYSTRAILFYRTELYKFFRSFQKILGTKCSVYLYSELSFFKK